MIKEKIKKIIEKIINDFFKTKLDFEINQPNNFNFGDYSTTIAFKLAKQLKKIPLEIAKIVKNNFPQINEIQKVDIINNGFLNFWLSEFQLINQLNLFSKNQFNFPQYFLGLNKKIMVEYAQPNTLKLFHIGHLRNITTGEAIARIFESLGNKVIRTNYQGDVGLHIAKCLWAILNSKKNINKIKTLEEKIRFIGEMYTAGNKAYEDDDNAKQEILKINKMIYNQNPKILKLWEETKKWSLDYFDKIYKRLGTQFERLYFESEVTKRGLEISYLLLKNNILEKSQGAIVFNGKKYNLDTRVFINFLGLPTYEAKELALAEKELSDFGELDKNIHLTTPEQKSFFKVTFKVEELMNEKKFKNKQMHLTYEWVKLKTGKMSSREGNIIETNWLIGKVKEKIIKNFNSRKSIAEILAVASIKYSILKNSLSTPITFDIDESININGNSATYLIYTYVRCKSVLNKANNYNSNNFKKIKINDQELNLLRRIYQFTEVVYDSGKHFAPNYIANYLYNLASEYNLFYQKNPILNSEKKIKNFRLLITQTVANIIKKGLYLLGIETVEKM